MSNSMDPNLVAQLNRICDDYGRRHHLSADARQEVFDHLQDSLEGYLTGQTRVTADDALLIARARLGDVKGVVAQLRPEQAYNAQWLARVSIATTTGFLTIIVLPLAILLYNPPAGGSAEATRFLLLLPLCFAVVETGVFLTARVDMRSRWQRGVSLALVIPAIVIFCFMLTIARSGIAPATVSGVVGALLLRALAIACLAGHGLLALILMAPMKREPTLAVL